MRQDLRGAVGEASKCTEGRVSFGETSDSWFSEKGCARKRGRGALKGLVRRLPPAWRIEVLPFAESGQAGPFFFPFITKLSEKCYEEMKTT